jgi:hypothetical protein
MTSGHEHEHSAAGRVPSESLVLDIGGDIGALLIHTPAALDDAEIEISPAADPAARTHNQVHPRRVPDGLSYSAVFPSVPAGEYLVWRDQVAVHGTVSVHGGEVAEYHWE